MKKIFILLLLLLSLSGANAQNNTYNDFIKRLEAKNKVIEKNENDLTSYLNSHYKKDINYYTKVLEKVENKKIKLKNEIEILYYLNFCKEEKVYCQNKLDFSNEPIEWDDKNVIKNEITIRKDKIKELEEDIILRTKVLKSFTKQEKKKLEEQLESREKRNKEYIMKAEKEEEKEQYKDALRNYKTACRAIDTYGCHYSIGNVSFIIWKKYFDKRNLYWYENLANKSWKEAKENLNKALELATSDIQKKDIELLIKLINEYPNKKKGNTEKLNKKHNLKSKKTEIKKVTPLKKPLSKKEKIEKKVNLILKRLDKITAKYSPDKKKKLYAKLFTQLERYKAKTKNSDLKSIIELLITKLQK